MPKKRSATLALAAAGGLLLAASVFGWLAPVSDLLTVGVSRAAAPLHAAGVRVRELVAGASAPDDAVDAAILRAMDDLKVENARLRTLVAENESLKAALRYQERFKERTVLARVISDSTDDALKALVIDRGTEDGVMADLPVVVGDGIIIGKVLNAGRRTSTVLLLSDSRSRLAVSVQNADDTLGVLAGDRGLSMSIGLIPQVADVSPGDIVITSGAEPHIRGGLPVGAVTKVIGSSQEPFQSADVQPFFSSMRPVFVQVLAPDQEL
jgi:rod shape-determining protein MreC